MTDTETDGRLLVTIPSAAKKLSLSRSTLYELVNRGQIPVIRIGRAVRVRLSDLEAWVAEQASTD